MENEIDGLEDLEKWGADPQEAISRVLGDIPLYIQLVQEYGENNEIDLLRFEIEQTDYSSAFRIAHSMKGASVSLSLTPLTEALSDLVEALRPWYENRPETDPESKKERMLYYMQQVDLRWNEYCSLVLA